VFAMKHVACPQIKGLEVLFLMMPGMRTPTAMNALMSEQHTLVIADTFVNEEPSAEELADIALMASAEVRRGYPPDSPPNCSADLLVLLNLDAANILFNVLKMTGGHGIRR